MGPHGAALLEKTLNADSVHLTEAKGTAESRSEAWQPIATAPKDGTVVVLADWSDYHQWWSFTTSYWRRYLDDFGEGFGWVGHEPTHWAPLPPPQDSPLSDGDPK